MNESIRDAENNHNAIDGGPTGAAKNEHDTEAGELHDGEQPEVAVLVDEHGDPIRPASGLAVLSLLLALVSVGGCFATGLGVFFVDMIVGLGFLVLPIVSVAGMVCAILALMRIRLSKGVLLGKPLARAGLMLCSIAIVLQGAVLVGILLPFRQRQVQLVPVAEHVALASVRNDLVGTKGILADDLIVELEANPTLFSDFGFAVTQAVGEPDEAAFTLRDMLLGRKLIEAAERRGIDLTAGVPRSADNPDPTKHPIRLIGDRADATMLVFLDEEELNFTKQVKVLDILLVVSEENWVAATLHPDGPANEIAVLFEFEMFGAPSVN